ncbi:MAG: zinc ribbon domain-containing protein [Candidatus Omnitrophica bacterium]|nr:zinc ribbon domain-containing protein [Candidatus Omnitrophota bacterium]
MSDKSNRFLRLELFSKLNQARANKKLSRFERLEIDGHKIKIEIKEAAAPEERKCPRCGADIKPGKNSCRECLYVLERKPQKEEKINPWSDLCPDCGRLMNKASRICEYCSQKEREKKLESWQAICPGCSRVVNKTQGACMYCGWQLTNQPVKKAGPKKIERAAFTSKTISVNVNGVRYSSTDQYLPPGVKDLMKKIDEEGYSKEIVDEWVRESKTQDDMLEAFQRQSLEDRIVSLRFTIAWRIIVAVISFIFFFVFMFLARR